MVGEVLGRLWKPWLDKPPEFSGESIYIAVVGMTGAGKTTFINKSTNVKMKIGRKLKSCTKEIQIATTEMDGYQVNLIDTPGFDDTKMEESHVLAIITDYLKSGVRLSGILYLHPLNRGRMGRAATRNLGMIQNLVGPENMKMVRLVTTMWDRVSPKDGQDEVEELQEEFWSEMLAAGAKTDRCIDATEDGKRIIRSILKSPPVRLKFQKEIENGVEPAATAAGKFVADKIMELLEERDKEIKALQNQLAGLTCDRNKEAERERESQENLQKLNEAQESIEDLKEELRKLRESVADLKNSKSGGCIIL